MATVQCSIRVHKAGLGEHLQEPIAFHHKRLKLEESSHVSCMYFPLLDWPKGLEGNYSLLCFGGRGIEQTI